MSKFKKIHFDNGAYEAELNTDTGEIRNYRKIRVRREPAITAKHIEDAKRLAEGIGQPKQRAKRKNMNPFGKELFGYMMNNKARFMRLLKTVCDRHPTLKSNCDKNNFNISDLARILCQHSFTSDSLFSTSARGREYTMAAYRTVLDEFVGVCRIAWTKSTLQACDEEPYDLVDMDAYLEPGQAAA